MIQFEYKGKIYKPSNLEAKLKKLGITINDITILNDSETNTERIQKAKLAEQKALHTNKTIYFYWDTKLKGWFKPTNILKPGDYFFNDVKTGRFKLVGQCDYDNVAVFERNLFKKVLFNVNENGDSN